MVDITENIRETLTNAINAAPKERKVLEIAFGEKDVWDTKELPETFEILGFRAPLCIVKKKSTGEEGTVMFQHRPRFYYGFEPVK